MRAIVVYESMYGSTHAVADAIGRGLAEAAAQVIVIGVGESNPDVLAGADLLVVGGPTHVHGMTSKRTRQAAVQSDFTWVTPDRVSVRQRQACLRAGSVMLVLTLSARDEAFTALEPTWSDVVASLRLPPARQ